MSDLGDGTRVVRGGDEPVTPGAPLRPSPVFAAPYHLGEDPYATDFYARPGNPTLRVLERAIGDLDDGDCLVFATGMAAISAAVLAVCGPVTGSWCPATATTRPARSARAS